MRTPKLWLIIFCVMFLTGCEVENRSPRPTDKPEPIESVDTEKLIAKTKDATNDIELYLFNLDAANRDWNKARTHQLELEKTLRSIDAAILNLSRDIASTRIKGQPYATFLTARAQLFECRALVLMQMFNISNVDIYDVHQ